MGARKWVVVLTVFALLTGQTSAAIVRPAGIVLEASHARQGSHPALRGATVFAEQQFSTDNAGELRLQLGEAQVALGRQSTLWLTQQDGALRGVLRQGTVSFAWKKTGELDLAVHGVVIRASGAGPAHGAVQLSGARQLTVTSYSGSLTATFAGTTQTIPAGSTYTATLAEPQGTEGAGQRRGVPPIVWVAIAGGVGLGVGLWLALRDGDQPVSPSVP